MYFKDCDGLGQAIMVAKKHPVNLSGIEKWCEDERQLEVYEEFIKLLKKN